MKARHVFMLATPVAAAVASVWLSAAAPATAPSTQPSTRPSKGDRVLYVRADGRVVEFGPADSSFGFPANRDVAQILVQRPGVATPGVWIAIAIAGTQPTTGPTTGPTTVPTTGPTTNPSTLPTTKPTNPPTTLPTTLPTTRPTDGVIVEPSESWSAPLLAGKTVYLRRGQTYRVGRLIDWDGRVRDVKLLAIGDGPAPLIRVPDGDAIQLIGAKNVTIDGIAFTADAATGHGIQVVNSANITVRNIDVSNFAWGVNCEATGNKRSSNFTLADSTIHDIFHPRNQHSSGTFVNATDGISIVRNKFIRCGWKPGAAPGSTENHGAYICGDNGPATITDNEFAENSSHGLQARSGGIIARNTFRDNPIHLSVGLVNGGGPIVVGGVTAVVQNNSFAGTRLLAGKPRGWAIEVANAKSIAILANRFDGSAVQQNDLRLGTAQAAIKLDVCNLLPGNPDKGKAIGVQAIEIQGNTGTWPGGIYSINPGSGAKPTGQTDLPLAK